VHATTPIVQGNRGNRFFSDVLPFFRSVRKYGRPGSEARQLRRQFAFGRVVVGWRGRADNETIICPRSSRPSRSSVLSAIADASTCTAKCTAIVVNAKNPDPITGVVFQGSLTFKDVRVSTVKLFAVAPPLANTLRTNGTRCRRSTKTAELGKMFLNFVFNATHDFPRTTVCVPV